MRNRFIIILIFLFAVTGCFGSKVTEENNNDENNVSNGKEAVWDGPTEGPWEVWNRNNNGDQYFKYEFMYEDEDRTGWVTINIDDLGNEQYEFNVEILVNNYYSVGTSPTGETSYSGTANFVLDSKDGFFEATYEKGEMSGIIYEIIGRIDEQSAIIVDFNETDIEWVEGSSSKHIGNNVTVNVKALTEVSGITGYNVELEYLNSGLGDRIYVINPDIRYPLSIYEASPDKTTFYEFTLVEYSYN